MEKKVAVIIPVNVPKEFYIKKFIGSYKKNESYDLFFIITDEYEKNIIKDFVDNTIMLITLPMNIDHETLRKKNIYPTFKKFYGLEYINQNFKYDYAICIDIDCIILNMSNIYDTCKNFCDIKYVYGGNIINNKDVCYNINNESLNFINKFKKINKIEFDKIDIKIYFWFSQIPIYDMKVVNNFLKFIKFESYNRIISFLLWETFEYVIYYYYCMIYHDYNIFDLGSIFPRNFYGSLEVNMNFDTMKILDNYNIKINWQSGNNVIDYDQHYIIYHIDRQIFENVVDVKYCEDYKIYDNFDLMDCDLFMLKNIDSFDDLINILKNSYASCVSYDKINKIGYFKCDYNDIFFHRHKKIHDLKYQTHKNFITVLKKNNKNFDNNIMIPTYINHKTYYHDLMISLKHILDFDNICVYTIFSSLSEMQNILVDIYHKFPKINLKFLIFDVKYDSKNKFIYQCVKKIWGFEKIKYKYLMILDSDFKFINDINIEQTINKYKDIVFLTKPKIQLDIDVLNNINKLLCSNFMHFPLDLPWIINKDYFDQMYKYILEKKYDFDNLLENNMPIFEIVLYNLFLVKNNLAKKIIYTDKYQKKYNEVFLFEMKLTQEDRDKLCYDFAFSKNLNYNEKYYLSVHNDR